MGIRVAIVAAIMTAAAGAHAADDPAGRWSGVAQIPGIPLQVTVDLDRDAQGGWIGSAVIPELNVRGVPLTAIGLQEGSLTFALKDALATGPEQPARFEAHLDSPTVMTGTFAQAGNSAPLRLQRVGPAQVDLPPRSTPVARALEGTWIGDYELMGYARHVTLRFVNHDAAPATAEFIIVGKKNNNLPVDLITQDGDFVRVESHEIGINFEGRLDQDGELHGTYEQGPFEVPFALRRSEAQHP